MKRIIKLITILSVALIITSCNKEPDHSIRVHNALSIPVLRLRLGEVVRFENLNSNNTSEYMSIEEGEHIFSGIVNSNVNLSDPITIEGNGAHQWTLTIESLDSLRLREDFN